MAALLPPLDLRMHRSSLSVRPAPRAATTASAWPRPSRRWARSAAVQASYGGPERETLRNLPVPASPPVPGPPPPPPPPPPPSPRRTPEVSRLRCTRAHCIWADDLLCLQGCLGWKARGLQLVLCPTPPTGGHPCTPDRLLPQHLLSLPPPHTPDLQLLNKRQLLVAGGFTVAGVLLGRGAFSLFRGAGSVSDEQAAMELDYVAGAMGVPGFRPPGAS